MTANAPYTLRRSHDVLRVSSPHRNRFGIGNSQLHLSHSPLPRAAPRPIGSENAHPGPVVWLPVLILVALSVAAYFLFIAKATGVWPFGQ